MVYRTETLENLVTKDTDKDGIPDWEEGLWGTDPTKKETTPGTPDRVAIENQKASQEKNDQKTSTEGEADNLTTTDKFSRELFSTIVALNQNGAIDQATIDALSTSLNEQIQNSTPRKVFVLKDIKITNDESTQAVKKYSDTLNAVYAKYSTGKGVPDILQELINDEENMSILLELDPIIDEIEKIIAESLRIEVPRSLSVLHLDLINSAEQLLENIKDIKLLEKDIILAIGAITHYWENALILEAVANKLTETIRQKLNN